MNYTFMKTFEDIIVNTFSKAIPRDDFSEHLSFRVWCASRIYNADQAGFLINVVNRIPNPFEIFVNTVSVGMMCLV